MGDSLIGLADNVRFIASHNNSFDTSTESINDLVSALSFANPSDLMFMARYFNLEKGQLADADIISKLKSIYVNYRESDMPLFDFMSQIGVKIGGKFSTDASTFLNKFYTYLSLRSDEKNIENRLNTIKNERASLETNINENSNNIQRGSNISGVLSGEIQTNSI